MSDLPTREEAGHLATWYANVNPIAAEMFRAYADGRLIDLESIDRSRAYGIAESIDGLPENAKMWHALADDILDAALGIGDER